MAVRNNRDVYSTVEFDRWAERAQLRPDERHVLTTYLDPAGRTVDAGTGGGRIALALRELGFRDLAGFDFVPDLIAAAQRRDPDGAIRFEVADATALPYPDAAFDQIVYLQQILSLIEGEENRRKALREAARILKPGGVAVFSFLSHEVRSGSPMYRVLLGYLGFIRFFTRATRTSQTIPWLRLGGRFNPGFLLDRAPYVYWYRAAEAAELLAEHGFELTAIGSGRQATEGRLRGSPEELAREPLEGLLFCVCRRV